MQTRGLQEIDLLLLQTGGLWQVQETGLLLPWAMGLACTASASASEVKSVEERTMVGSQKC